jgi:iron(III) transport system ATP-binding protein
MTTPSPAATSLPAIRVENLSKTFRRSRSAEIVKPIDGVSLEVAQGETLVLLGPSGCGKTTLLRCIAGLERPDAGDIWVGDTLVFSAAKRIFIPPNKRDVSMMFQAYALWPHMSVAKNVTYPLATRGVPKAEARERVSEALKAVGVAELANEQPSHLSGGQQQRVALARAIVARPAAVLFDEPLSNVDAKVRETLRGELIQRQKQLGFTAVYVTHDQTEAMAIASRIAVLRSGQVQQLAVPSAVYERPANHYVADFVGAANFWSAVVKQASDEAVMLAGPLGDIRVDATALDFSPAPGAAVTVMSRPEHWVLDTQPGQNAVVVDGVCTSSTYVGGQYDCIFDAGATTVRVRVQEQTREGQRARLAILPRHFHLLSGEVAESTL